MKTNQAGIDLIKRFEGVKLRAYRCPAGVLTIGVGSTKGVHAGMVITQAEADERLRDDLQDAEEAVERLVKVPLNENEHAALVSLVFNIGAGAFGHSTLLRLLNGHERIAATAQFKRWNRGGGKVLPGLVKRRAAETALFVAAP
jgi:lysozyme